jgi:hypothetical protein
MKSLKLNLRGIVLTWTVFTTAFFWTSTMRILYKPEISSWSIFNFGGQGFIGEFWLLLIIVFFALFLFYLEGRGKLRPLFHILLLTWHSLTAGIIIYGSLQPDMEISFGTWGLSISFIWLVTPFVMFLLSTIALIVKEIKEKREILTYNWTEINWKLLLIAIVLSVFALVFFQLGSGFNWLVKIAVSITIIQWILLTESVNRPYKNNSKPN